MKKTIKNEYGENIHIKIENGKVMVHHEDCTENFIEFSELVTEYFINQKELITIVKSIPKCIN